MVIEGLLLSNGFGFQTSAPCKTWVHLVADSGLRNGPKFSGPQKGTFAASLHLVVPWGPIFALYLGEFSENVANEEVLLQIIQLRL